MKVIKLIIGALGSLFAIAHGVALVGMLINGTDVVEPFTASAYAGHGVGIATGLIIAILCFRGKKNGKQPDVDATPTQANAEEGRLSF